jgi:hypothetical protein
MDTSTLVLFKFCGFDVGGGAIPEFRDRLIAAERSLERGMGLKGRDLGIALGITNIGGYRANAGRHGLGRAVDIDYSAAPYIATRTPKASGGFIYGGEAAGAQLHGIREAAMAACDRAVAWHYGKGTADLAGRRSGESTGSVWDRFKHVDEAWRAYFGAIFTDSPNVQRLPGIPPLPTELLPITAGLAVGVSVTDRAQVIADFDAIRIPTVFGMPAARPAKTRNPVRGFLPFARELAIALCDVGGMRWGACDFGPSESGDMMHWDR